jgi:hypothetical protein
VRARLQPESPDPAAMPPWLRRFDPDDWPVGPAPEWWRDSGYDPLVWPHFKAKLEHMRARRAWLASHGDQGPAA